MAMGCGSQVPKEYVINMKGVTKMIKSRAMVSSLGVMGLAIKEIILMITDRVMEKCTRMMFLSIQEIGTKEFVLKNH